MIGYEFNNFKKYKELKHLVTDRLDGHSKEPFDSLNVGLHVTDNKSTVLKNRQEISKYIGYDIKDFVFMEQVHGSNIRIIKKDNKGKGSTSLETAVKNTDAMITNEKGIVLSVFVADCIPIIIYDPHKQILAVVHGGWRGLTKNVIGKTIDLMNEKFGSIAEELIVGIGPTICEKCCEIGNEVVNIINTKFPKLAKRVIKKRNGKMYIDMKIAKLQLEEKGVRDIEIADICTYENKKFYSYRRNKVTGRFGLFAVLS